MPSQSELQLSLIEVDRASDEDWTFDGASTRDLTHCYHDYPARMIPQVARKVLDLFGHNSRVLFDPYCGTGTSLVEGFVRGIHVIGTDLNPLARLIAKAKITSISTELLDDSIKRFVKYVNCYRIEDGRFVDNIPRVKNLEFWFKPPVVSKLAYVKGFIDQIAIEDIALFFKVAFSETVRESSNTKISEFKLFRKAGEDLDRFDPDVFETMLVKLNRNRHGLRKFNTIIHLLERAPLARILDFNSVSSIPPDAIEHESIDLVLTSPPYGDSHTTVAYGQYSRLSSEWMGFQEARSVDNMLMGGQNGHYAKETASKTINIAIKIINEKDPKRGKEVSAFYNDLEASIRNVACVIRRGGIACYVVGNRTVKGIVLPTDLAVMNFYQEYGFEHIRTFRRNIPNKRMPARNSPSNIPGVIEKTMTNEYIVVMQKK